MMLGEHSKPSEILNKEKTMKRIIVALMVIMLVMPTTQVQAKSKSKKYNFVTKSIEYMMDALKPLLKEFKKNRDLLAEVAYHENWHTDKDHLAAYYTMAVVMNRVKGKNWPNTVESVLYQKGQYTTTKYFFKETIPQECYDMATDVLIHGTPDVPENVVYQATFKQGHGDWIPPINGEHFCYE